MTTKRKLFHHQYKDAANKARLDDRGRAIADTVSCIDPYFHYPTIQELIARFSHTQRGQFVFDSPDEFDDEPEDDLPVTPYEETPSGVSLHAIERFKRGLQKKTGSPVGKPENSSPTNAEPSGDGSLGQ